MPETRPEGAEPAVRRISGPSLRSTFLEPIIIRDVTGKLSGDPRYARAFAGVSPERRQLFQVGSELTLPDE